MRSRRSRIALNANNAATPQRAGLDGFVLQSTNELLRAQDIVAVRWGPDAAGMDKTQKLVPVRLRATGRSRSMTVHGRLGFGIAMSNGYPVPGDLTGADGSGEQRFSA